MEKNSVLLSGKLGDLFHSLYVPNYIYRTTGKRSILYITDVIEPFERGIESTVTELVPILSQQAYFYDIRKWEGEPIQFNTTLFRKSPFLYRTGWTNIMHSLFLNRKAPLIGPWLETMPIGEDIGLVISRIPKTPMTEELGQWYYEKIKDFNGAIFLGSEAEFNAFPLREICNFVPSTTLEMNSRIIASSKLFIGNQSSPLALAWALGVNRAVELLPEPHPDFIHYEAEKEYYNFESIRTQ
jgi:hypothetical protein